VQLRFSHVGPASTISTTIQLRDNNSGSSCTCGSTNALTPAATYFTRTMTFNCGACSYGTDWSINLTAFTAGGTVGTTTLKQISVFD
jgi:hypothetical protein